MAIVCKEVPSSVIEDTYLLEGVVTNGTFRWTKELKLSIRSTYITGIEGPVGSDKTEVELGAKITAKDLPEIEVYVYSGSAKALRRTSANWTLAYYLDSDGGRHEVADAKVNDLSAVDTTKAGYRYFLPRSCGCFRIQNRISRYWNGFFPLP